MNQDLTEKEQSFVIAVLIVFVVLAVSIFVYHASEAEKRTQKPAVKELADKICKESGYKGLHTLHRFKAGKANNHTFGSKLPRVVLECEV